MSTQKEHTVSNIHVNIYMNKHALVLGGGSKWGAAFTKNLADNNYHIDLITSSDFSYNNVTTHKIDWWATNEENIYDFVNPLKNKIYDFIFFNQNSGGGPNEQSFAPGDVFPIDLWHKQNWINCQLPYVVVKSLSKSIKKTTKVGWMITGLIDGKDREMWKYAGYASVKSTNVHIMRGFAKYHHGIFFALNPSWFPIDEYNEDSEKIRILIESLTKKENGSILEKN